MDHQVYGAGGSQNAPTLVSPNSDPVSTNSKISYNLDSQNDGCAGSPQGCPAAGFLPRSFRADSFHQINCELLDP